MMLLSMFMSMTSMLGATCCEYKSCTYASDSLNFSFHINSLCYTYLFYIFGKDTTSFLQLSCKYEIIKIKHQ